MSAMGRGYVKVKACMCSWEGLCVHTYVNACMCAYEYA